MSHSKSKSDLPVEEALERVGKELQAEYGQSPIPRKVLVKRVVAITGCSRDSVLPSDYSYNLVNRAGVSCERPMFERVQRGYYRYLGRNAKYSGAIWWQPSGGKERQVGEWIDGVAHFSQDPRS